MQRYFLFIALCYSAIKMLLSDIRAYFKSGFITVVVVTYLVSNLNPKVNQNSVYVIHLILEKFYAGHNYFFDKTQTPWRNMTL